MRNDGAAGATAAASDDGHRQTREGGLENMIILCADDYALTEGVSRAIGELAAAQRLSATSVLVTSAHWSATAPRLCVHRGHLSVGLHLDLTLGAPLGPMPKLAPAGKFPGLRGLLARSLLGRRGQQTIGHARAQAKPGDSNGSAIRQIRNRLSRRSDHFVHALRWTIPEAVYGREPL